MLTHYAVPVAYLTYWKCNFQTVNELLRLEHEKNETEAIHTGALSFSSKAGYNCLTWDIVARLLRAAGS